MVCEVQKIDPACVYPVREAQRVLGLSPWGWRCLKRRGLKTVKISRNGFVRGADIVSIIDREIEGQAPRVA